MLLTFIDMTSHRLQAISDVLPDKRCQRVSWMLGGLRHIRVKQVHIGNLIQIVLLIKESLTSHFRQYLEHTPHTLLVQFLSRCSLNF